MTLAPISSYGSISTFQDYVSDIDEEMGDEPQEFHEFRKLTMKVRGSENCRRQAFLVVILLTFLVILFGISATDDSPKVASNLCRQLLAFMTPSATAQVEN